MRVVALIVVGVVTFAACSGGSGGSGGVGPGVAALDQYVDRLGSAYCNWLKGCGKTQDVAACLSDFNADSDTLTYRSCAAAADYYAAHQSELEACLNQPPSCSTDDPSTFCPALDFDSLAKSCAAGGTTTPDAGSTAGACGSYAANAYKCAGNSIQQCRGGQWSTVSACTCSVSVGDPRKPPYASTCKSSGTGSVECSYAGSSCMVCKPDTACSGT